MTGEHGTALIGTLAIGFAVVLVVVQSLLVLGRLDAVSANVAEVASHAAQQGARYGGTADAERIARRLLPDADIVVRSDGKTLSVVVTVVVPLIGPESSPVRQTVTGRATSTLSPYRSRP